MEPLGTDASRNEGTPHLHRGRDPRVPRAVPDVPWGRSCPVSISGGVSGMSRFSPSPGSSEFCQEGTALQTSTYMPLNVPKNVPAIPLLT